MSEIELAFARTSRRGGGLDPIASAVRVLQRAAASTGGASRG